VGKGAKRRAHAAQHSVGFAEPVIGPATSGRTRWLSPPYILSKHQLAELEEAVCRNTQQKGGDEGCDICGRPNPMDELTHNTDSRLTPPSQKLRAFALGY
jgi:hypothetical protein